MNIHSKTNLYFFYILFLFLFPLGALAQDLDFQKMIGPVQPQSKFTQKGYQVWCGSMTKGDDGNFTYFTAGGRIHYLIKTG